MYKLRVQLIDGTYAWFDEDQVLDAQFEQRRLAILRRQIGPRTIFPVSETTFSSEEISSWRRLDYVEPPVTKERRLSTWIVWTGTIIAFSCIGLMFMTYYLQKGF